MKKQFLLFVIALTLFACNKNDDGNEQVALTNINVQGKYYFNYFTRSDGSRHNYYGSCNEKRDTIIINYFPNKIEVQRVFSNCTNSFNETRCDNFFIENNKIVQCNSLFNGTATSFDARNLTIRFDEPQRINFGGNPSNPLPVSADRTYESMTITRF
jgi:hypothetical protein